MAGDSPWQSVDFPSPEEGSWRGGATARIRAKIQKNHSNFDGIREKVCPKTEKTWQLPLLPPPVAWVMVKSIFRANFLRIRLLHIWSLIFMKKKKKKKKKKKGVFTPYDPYGI